MYDIVIVFLKDDSSEFFLLLFQFLKSLNEYSNVAF